MRQIWFLCIVLKCSANKILNMAFASKNEWQLLLINGMLHSQLTRQSRVVFSPRTVVSKVCNVMPWGIARHLLARLRLPGRETTVETTTGSSLKAVALVSPLDTFQVVAMSFWALRALQAG